LRHRESFGDGGKDGLCEEGRDGITDLLVLLSKGASPGVIARKSLQASKFFDGDSKASKARINAGSSRMVHPLG
jgi:hypothetical protein